MVGGGYVYVTFGAMGAGIYGLAVAGVFTILIARRKRAP
jgi:hypothetical protein